MVECPEKAISEGSTQMLIDPGKCTDCAKCMPVCPVDACVPG